jgi:hypothetical protein
MKQLLAVALMILSSACGDPDEKTEIAPPPSAETKTFKIYEETDFRFLTMEIHELVCRFGPPVEITNWDLDEETRFLIFEGKFLEDRSGEHYPYVVAVVSSIGAERAHNQYLIRSVSELEGERMVEELENFNYPVIDAIPGTISGLKDRLGAWSFEYAMNDGKRRLVYDRRMCIDSSPALGAYFDLDNDRVVNAKGVTSEERIAQLRRNAGAGDSNVQETW